MLLTQSCSRDSVPVIPTIVGSYDAGTSIELGNTVMFTNNSYATTSTGGTQGPVTDQQVIASYLQRHNIAGFVLNSSTVPNADRFSISIDTLVSVQYQDSRKSFFATIEDDRILKENRFYGDSAINLIAKDSTVFTTIPQDSCYKFNALASRLEYQVASVRVGTGPVNLYYRRRYYAKFENGSLTVKFINSSLIKNNGASNCSSLFTEQWGTDQIRNGYFQLPHLLPGDTLVMQTRKVVLQKR